jgi:hypothetical protein
MRKSQMSRELFEPDPKKIEILLKDQNVRFRRWYEDQRYVTTKYHIAESLFFRDEIVTKCNKFMRFDTGSISNQRIEILPVDQIDPNLLCKLCGNPS